MGTPTAQRPLPGLCTNTRDVELVIYPGDMFSMQQVASVQDVR